MNFTSDINIWTDGSQPENTIRGHKNAINSIAVFRGDTLVSGDADGRILSWNISTGVSSRPTGVIKHEIGVQHVVANSKFVYSAAGDQTMA